MLCFIADLKKKKKLGGEQQESSADKSPCLPAIKHDNLANTHEEQANQCKAPPEPHTSPMANMHTVIQSLLGL